MTHFLFFFFIFFFFFPPTTSPSHFLSPITGIFNTLLNEALTLKSINWVMFYVKGQQYILQLLLYLWCVSVADTLVGSPTFLWCGHRYIYIGVGAQSEMSCLGSMARPAYWEEAVRMRQGLLCSNLILLRAGHLTMLHPSWKRPQGKVNLLVLIIKIVTFRLVWKPCQNERSSSTFSWNCLLVSFTFSQSTWLWLLYNMKLLYIKFVLNN